MKETKVYVDELPEYCDDCPCSLRDKDDCAYCNLLHKNIGYDFGKRPKHCPLQLIKTHDRELVKEAVRNQTQLAIQELEKAKDTIKHFCNIHNDEYYGVKSQVKGIEQDVCDQINQQIKELKGENFKCEICGEITPKNCEGGEPNVCADCVPVETHDLRLHIEPQSHENNFLD